VGGTRRYGGVRRKSLLQYGVQEEKSLVVILVEYLGPSPSPDYKCSYNQTNDECCAGLHPLFWIRVKISILPKLGLTPSHLTLIIATVKAPNFFHPFYVQTPKS